MVHCCHLINVCFTHFHTSSQESQREAFFPSLSQLLPSAREKTPSEVSSVVSSVERLRCEKCLQCRNGPTPLPFCWTSDQLVKNQWKLTPGGGKQGSAPNPTSSPSGAWGHGHMAKKFLALSQVGPKKILINFCRVTRTPPSVRLPLPGKQEPEDTLPCRGSANQHFYPATASQYLGVLGDQGILQNPPPPSGSSHPWGFWVGGLGGGSVGILNELDWRQKKGWHFADKFLRQPLKNTWRMPFWMQPMRLLVGSFMSLFLILFALCQWACDPWSSPRARGRRGSACWGAWSVRQIWVCSKGSFIGYERCIFLFTVNWKCHNWS